MPVNLCKKNRPATGCELIDMLLRELIIAGLDRRRRCCRQRKYPPYSQKSQYPYRHLSYKFAHNSYPSVFSIPDAASACTSQSFFYF